MRRGPWQEEDTAQKMDLCQHHLQAGGKEREKTVLNNNRTRTAKATTQKEYTATDR